jgi:hypothetical protein
VRGLVLISLIEVAAVANLNLVVKRRSSLITAEASGPKPWRAFVRRATPFR